MCFHICIWSGNNKLSAFVELDALFRKMQNCAPILNVGFIDDARILIENLYIFKGYGAKKTYYRVSR